MPGKAEWLANGLPREGENATVPSAGELADPDPPTCALNTPVADVRAALEAGRYGFCLVLTDRRVVLGRVRRTALNDADGAATAETVMEPGPSTVRFDLRADELIRRLTEKDLKTAIVTSPDGVLFGVFRRDDAAARLAERAGA